MVHFSKQLSEAKERQGSKSREMLEKILLLFERITLNLIKLIMKTDYIFRVSNLVVNLKLSLFPFLEYFYVMKCHCFLLFFNKEANVNYDHLWMVKWIYLSTKV